VLKQAKLRRIIELLDGGAVSAGSPGRSSTIALVPADIEKPFRSVGRCRVS
jgi:hypothetical protein